MKNLRLQGAATNYALRVWVSRAFRICSAGADVGVYQTLLDRGELKTRIYAVAPLPAWERLARTGVRRALRKRNAACWWTRRGLLTAAWARRTALFMSRIRMRPSTSGIAGDEMYPEGAMLDRVRAADKAGLQTMIHAIGDRANDLILDDLRTG